MLYNNMVMVIKISMCSNDGRMTLIKIKINETLAPETESPVDNNLS